MRLYHGTDEDAAAAITTAGFRNSALEPFQVALGMAPGVWLASVPMHNSGATLAVDMPDDVLEDYELIEDPPSSFRVWVVPAEVLNRYPVAEVDPDVIDDLVDAALDAASEGEGRR
jgi:hypothetical protein